MKVGSLFSGGGLGDFGWVMAGYEIAWQVEVDKYCQKVLELRFPESKKYHDIKTLKTEELEPVDIIAGGFPCQPFSVAGKQHGADDDRNLWPEMLRIIKGLKPRWVVAENVPGIIDLYLDVVLSDLAAEGYTCWPFVFSSHSLGAWHKRERCWIVANRIGKSSEIGRHDNADAKEGGIGGYNEGRGRGDDRWKPNSEENGIMGKASTNGWGNADKNSRGFEQRSVKRERKKRSIEAGKLEGSSCGERRDPYVANTGLQRSQINEKQTAGIKQCGEDVADARQQYEQRNTRELEADKTKRATSILSVESSGERFKRYWATEPNVGRVAHGVASRVDRLKALGNGQVPACTAFIGSIIREFERLNGP